MPLVNYDHVDSGGRTSAYIAARDGDADMIKFLHKKGASFTIARRDTGTLPLWIASQNGHIKVVALLVSFGCDPDSADALGFTAVHAAALSGQTAMVSVLAEVGANLSARAVDGTTPVLVAAQNEHERAVNLLVRVHRVDIRDSLAMARQNGQNRAAAMLESALRGDGHALLNETTDAQGRVPIPAGARHPSASTFSDAVIVGSTLRHPAYPPTPPPQERENTATPALAASLDEYVATNADSNAAVSPQQAHGSPSGAHGSADNSPNSLDSRPTSRTSRPTSRNSRPNSRSSLGRSIHSSDSLGIDHLREEAREPRDLAQAARSPRVSPVPSRQSLTPSPRQTGAATHGPPPWTATAASPSPSRVRPRPVRAKGEGEREAVGIETVTPNTRVKHTAMQESSVFVCSLSEREKSLEELRKAREGFKRGAELAEQSQRKMAALSKRLTDRDVTLAERDVELRREREKHRGTSAKLEELVDRLDELRSAHTETLENKQMEIVDLKQELEDMAYKEEQRAADATATHLTEVATLSTALSEAQSSHAASTKALMDKYEAALKTAADEHLDVHRETVELHEEYMAETVRRYEGEASNARALVEEDVASLKVMHSTAMQSIVEASHLQVLELKQQLSLALAQFEDSDAKLKECRMTADDREATARASASAMEQRYSSQLDELRKQLGDRNIDLMNANEVSAKLYGQLSDQSTLYEAAAPELYAQLEEASGRWADLEIELGVKEAALEASEARLTQLIAANSNLNQTLNSSMVSRERQAELEAELNSKERQLAQAQAKLVHSGAANNARVIGTAANGVPLTSSLAGRSTLTWVEREPTGSSAPSVGSVGSAGSAGSAETRHRLAEMASYQALARSYASNPASSPNSPAHSRASSSRAGSNPSSAQPSPTLSGHRTSPTLSLSGHRALGSSAASSPQQGSPRGSPRRSLGTSLGAVIGGTVGDALGLPFSPVAQQQDYDERPEGGDGDGGDVDERAQVHAHGVWFGGGNGGTPYEAQSPMRRRVGTMVAERLEERLDGGGGGQERGQEGGQDRATTNPPQPPPSPPGSVTVNYDGAEVYSPYNASVTTRDAGASGVHSSIKITHRKTPSPKGPADDSSSRPSSGGGRARASTTDHVGSVHPMGKSASGADIIPLDELRNVSPRRLLSQGYDPSVLELYLSEDDYIIAFSMPKQQFLMLPTFERNKLKRAVGLG